MIRITGGALRGRLIPSPAGKGVRPTSSVAREALFNVLQSALPGLLCPQGFAVLDLFAGSGIMGFEALSRGARFVESVEMNRTQALAIQNAALNLKVNNNIKVNCISVEKWLRDNGARQASFDLVYADPPFTQEYPDLRPFLAVLRAGGRAVFEHPTKKPPAWITEAAAKEECQVRKYGESSIAIFSKLGNYV
jgi:16S rRNA (guanine966-N2)-methyltransferase